jgi:hypothetical protein
MASVRLYVASVTLENFHVTPEVTSEPYAATIPDLGLETGDLPSLAATHGDVGLLD